MNNTANLPYNPALDGLRAVAILLVVLSHAHVPLFEGAFFGVDIFFVLSGYLITSLLLIEHHRTGDIGFWRFYQRRIFRLVPALLFMLAIYGLVMPRLWPDLDSVYSDILISALYLADYGIAFFDRPEILMHMWSLAVEEHFYLLWPPLLLFLLRRRRAGQLWQAIAALWVLGTGWRIFCLLHGHGFFETYFRFDTRFSGLMAGALLAAVLDARPRFLAHAQQHLHHILWLPLAIPLLLELGWDNPQALLWGVTVVELATVVLLLAVLPAHGLVHKMLATPAMIWLGRLSYGIYLWHYPIVRYLRPQLSWPLSLALTLVLATAMAALSYFTIERWALRQRDRIAPRLPVRRSAPRIATYQT